MTAFQDQVNSMRKSIEKLESCKEGPNFKIQILEKIHQTELDILKLVNEIKSDIENLKSLTLNNGSTFIEKDSNVKKEYVDDYIPEVDISTMTFITKESKK